MWRLPDRVTRAGSRHILYGAPVQMPAHGTDVVHVENGVAGEFPLDAKVPLIHIRRLEIRIDHPLAHLIEADPWVDDADAAAEPHWIPPTRRAEILIQGRIVNGRYGRPVSAEILGQLGYCAPHVVKTPISASRPHLVGDPVRQTQPSGPILVIVLQYPMIRGRYDNMRRKSRVWIGSIRRVDPVGHAGRPDGGRAIRRKCRQSVHSGYRIGVTRVEILARAVDRLY